MENDAPVYIIGHRNPDADSICSAIGYAAFKNREGSSRFQPVRCGNSNARIDAILERMGLPLPRFLGDVTPRVRDIMVPRERVHCVKVTQTCAEALEMIDRHDVRVLPVVDENDAVQGTLSIFQLGEFFIPKLKDPRAMRLVHTTLTDIVRSLKAEAFHLVEPDRLEELFVRVGAMDLRSFGKFANEEPTLAEQSIIVVGDRYDIQQKSIQVGVRLVVVTGGLEVEPEVVQLAKERGVSLIVSPYDSATTSWIVRAASRVDRLLVTDYPTFDAEEKVAAVKRKIAVRSAPAYLVLGDQSRLRGIVTRTNILRPVPTQLILVDHNEISQAVPGADEVEILEIIDHHRLGNLPTNQPILFLNEPVGSTCTIVADQFQRVGAEPEAAIAGVLMGGLISDTLNLNSPTTTAKDHRILAWLEGIAGIGRNDLAELVFTSGSVVIAESPEAVIRSDMKVYAEGEVSYSVSQIEELGFTNFWKRADELSEALERVRTQEDCYFSALLVTDINTQNSLLVVRGPDEVLDEVKYPRSERAHVFELAGIVSRKKQLIPYLTSLMQTLGVGTES